MVANTGQHLYLDQKGFANSQGSTVLALVNNTHIFRISFQDSELTIGWPDLLSKELSPGP